MYFTKLSILVPVYNEVATAEVLLRRVAAVVFPIAREIVVVDDGSTDGSREVLRRLADEGLIRLIVHKRNRGKGAAMHTALARATGDVVVVQDADLELDPGDLPRLLTPLLSGESRVCYGTRFVGRASRAQRRSLTYWANRALNTLSNLINGLSLTDFNTCYKMMAADVARALLLRESGFAMEAEITGKIARLGIPIAERPIHYEPRRFAEGKKIRALDVARYLRAMLRYRFMPFPASLPAVTPARSMAAADLPQSPAAARLFRAAPAHAHGAAAAGEGAADHARSTDASADYALTAPGERDDHV